MIELNREVAKAIAGGKEGCGGSDTACLNYIFEVIQMQSKGIKVNEENVDKLLETLCGTECVPYARLVIQKYQNHPEWL